MYIKKQWHCQLSKTLTDNNCARQSRQDFKTSSKMQSINMMKKNITNYLEGMKKSVFLRRLLRHQNGGCSSVG